MEQVLRPLSCAVFILEAFYFFHVLSAVCSLCGFFHIPDIHTFTVHLYFLGKKIISIVHIIDIQIHHGPPGHIRHAKGRCKLQSDLVAELCLVIAIG